MVQVGCTVAEELKQSDSAETPSAATPEKKDTEPTEKSSPATGDSASHIVDATEEWLGRSVIIVGATGPKKETA